LSGALHGPVGFRGLRRLARKRAGAVGDLRQDTTSPTNLVYTSCLHMSSEFFLGWRPKVGLRRAVLGKIPGSWPPAELL
jgi:hypothetical protein